MEPLRVESLTYFMSQDCIYDGVFLMLIGRGIRIPSVTVDPHDQFSRD